MPTLTLRYDLRCPPFAKASHAELYATALDKMIEIQKERYATADWNIYAAQASDGYTQSGDAKRCVELLNQSIMPICQYYAYVEVGMDDEDEQPGQGEPSTNLWRAYRRISVDAPFAMRKVRHRRDIYPVFRELFARRPEGVVAEGG